MKAVIMAGGQGSRLRPLTCNLPKPLARLCGKPVLEYIFDLLLRHGATEAALTLGYMADSISRQYGAAGYRQLKLDFFTEDHPLGTAGSVAAAARGWTESFLVLSGDAMCDLDLSAAYQKHQNMGNAVTIIGYEVVDPREYGLIQTDEVGFVTGFIEKPAWGQATTNTANTGIYILRPDILRFIPEHEAFDFANDLFPLLLARGERIFCQKMDGYWCDIGDLSAYLRCQKDMLNHKVQCEMPCAPQNQEGIYLRGARPYGTFTLIPPVFLGEEVEIFPGAKIGPNVILDNGTIIGEQARVRESVILENSSISMGAIVDGALICAGAALRKNSQVLEGSVIGEHATVGMGARVEQEVAVWPHKYVENYATAKEHVKYGNQNAWVFGEHGIGGEEGLPLTPEICAALGSAIGSVKSCKKAGVACDGSGSARALLMALTGGLMSAGCHVWSFGDCFEAQLSFFTGFGDLGVGIFVNGGGNPFIRVCGEGGLNTPRYLEREIEIRLRRGDVHRCAGDACKEITDMSAIRMIYAREMIKHAGKTLEGLCVKIESPNPRVRGLMEETLKKLGCALGSGPLLKLNGAGTDLLLAENGEIYGSEQLIALCCLQELERGHDVSLPYDAPEALDYIAAPYREANIIRYLNNPADRSDARARELTSAQTWVRDGLFRVVKLLSVCKETGKTVSTLIKELPPFFIERKRFTLPCSPSKLQDLLSGEKETLVAVAREGLVLRKRNGRILVTPSKNGRQVQVLAEAATMEVAQELCEGMEDFFSK